MSLEEVDELAARLAGMAQAGPRVASRAAPKVLEAAQADWGAGRAPGGAPWPPLASGGGVPLVGLTAQGTARADGASVELELPDAALPHQGGTQHVPRRQLLPDLGAALPPSYEVALEEAATAERGEP